MREFAAGHPEDGVLLRYADGELSASEARQVRAHTEACWQCRAELEALEATVADCVAYRKNVLQTELPAPPQPWNDLYRAMERADREAAAQPLAERVRASIAAVHAWRWGLLAAAALLAFTVYYEVQVPPVEAAVLLQRAVAAADAHPAPAHRLRVRMASQDFVRASLRQPMPDAAEALLRRAHYDDADPLSARSFENWRAGVGEKRDAVTAGTGQYEIRTTPVEGEVAEASLTLRAADFEPLAGKLEFRDKNWIEFSEITEPSSTDGSPVATHEEAPVQPAVPSRPVAFMPRLTASIDDELRVLTALHQIGADLGDPVEVKLDDGKVMVAGVSLAPERQRQIRALFEGQPNVSVRFDEPAAVSAPEDAVPAPQAANAVPSTAGVEARLEQRLGGRAALEQFNAQLLDANETAMARAYALRGLAQRFPAEAEAAMPAGEKAALDALAREDTAALIGQRKNLEVRLAPALAALDAPAAAQTGAGNFAAWQAAAEASFQAARREERLISTLAGVTAGGAPPELASDLARAVADVRTASEACLRLLGR